MEKFSEKDENGRLLNLVAALPDIVYVLDQSGHFIYINDTVRILGYEPAELAGKHFSAIVSEADREEVSRDVVLARIRSMDRFPESAPKLFDERRSGSRMTKDLRVRLLRKGGDEEFYGSVNAYGEYNPDPMLSGGSEPSVFVTMGIIHDVTSEVKYQRSLEANLAARELMLREIHRRVKDSLQVVASLAHLREMEMDESADRSAVEDVIARVKTIAMVHEALYQTESLEGARADEYFTKLGRFLEETYGALGENVHLEIHSASAMIPVDLLSNLALIAHELVRGAYGRISELGVGGKIALEFEDRERAFRLEVTDKPERGKDSSARRRGSVGLAPSPLGMDIVFALAKEIGAKLDIESAEGRKVVLTLDKP